MRFSTGDRSVYALVPFFLILSVGVVDIATDIYLPMMPLLVQYFLTSEDMGALTVSVYLFSFCLSGPVYGPVSDALGRRKVLLFGMGAFALFSFLCMLAWSVHSLIFFRFMQGLGGGVAWILGLAIVKDLYTTSESIDIVARISLITALSPAAAPIIGGYLGSFFGWHASFYVVAFCAVVIFFILLYALPESLPPKNRYKLSLKRVCSNYLILLSNTFFMGHAVVSALTFAAFFSYISIAPFFFIKELGVSVEAYGFHQMSLLSFYMIGTLLNKKGVARWGMERCLVGGLLLALIGAMIVLLSMLWGLSHAFYVTAIMTVYCIGNGVVFSNTSVQAMQTFPQNMGGAGAAFLSALEMSFASIAVFIAGSFYEKTMLPVGILLFTCTLLSCLLHWFFPRQSSELVNQLKGAG